MTIELFRKIKENLKAFIGSKVNYTHYIPSANKYVTSQGVLHGIGRGVNSECIIIGDKGKNKAIYFKYVNLTN